MVSFRGDVKTKKYFIFKLKFCFIKRWDCFGISFVFLYSDDSLSKFRDRSVFSQCCWGLYMDLDQFDP